MAQVLNALSFRKVHKNQRDYCEREGWFAFFQETKNMVKSYIFYSWFECQIFILEFNYYFFRKAKANSDLSRTKKEKQVLSYMVLWMLLKKLTGDATSLGLAFKTQKMVTWQGSGLLLHGLQLEEFDCGWIQETFPLFLTFQKHSRD